MGANRGQEPRPQRQDREALDREDLFEDTQGVFMISVAAELAGMHPQTLRVYEAKGLIKPSRSAKKTRLYSRQDVELLKRIQELTSEYGLNLAGVERVLSLERRMESMRRQLNSLRQEAERMEREMTEQIEAVHRSYRRELVRWEPPGEVLKGSDAKPIGIPITRPTSNPSGSSKPGATGDR